jgi:hypothetical protein
MRNQTHQQPRVVELLSNRSAASANDRGPSGRIFTQSPPDASRAELPPDQYACDRAAALRLHSGV